MNTYYTPQATHRVHLTGWMHGETFEDHADVVADSEDQAVDKAIEVVEARWDGKLEVGDCTVEITSTSPLQH